MEDNKEAVEDSPCGTDAALDEQQKQSQHVGSVEVENGTEGEQSDPPEHLSVIANPEQAPIGDSQVEKLSPPSTDKEICALTSSSTLPQVEPEEDERELNAENGFREEKELENDSTTVKEVFVANNGGGGVLTETEVQPEMEELKTENNSNIITPPCNSFLLDANDVTGYESGTEDDQAAFMQELETFHRERFLDFKPPKFYQEPLNCLKLWRAVVRLGGYEQVTSLKLWRQVGESFRPPKTCTTVSWTFRGFYEKALLEYEKYKMRSGELPFTDASVSDPASGNQIGDRMSPICQMIVDPIHPPGSGRARRDAAARAMQGWHSQRLLGNGEVADPIIKDKNTLATPKREKQLRNIGFLKRKGSSPVEHSVKVARVASKSQSEMMVVDVGVPADWVKVNVQKMKDCYEVYALVPGLLREEVRVQSDPAGRLVISGQPEQQDNPWGVAPFKKVVSLPTRIDPHHTSAVVTLHGQLFVRVPFEQADM
ncbi:AT-rich interactive domain-containing protein 3 [Castilleja foliolosa]|uniref:AT-rich interactive domain-containing protein 3 n=1 Tax=Castilleja foliolosa TaxID=1961234 RepID=A0ABD3CN29_9LAMI